MLYDVLFCYIFRIYIICFIIYLLYIYTNIMCFLILLYVSIFTLFDFKFVGYVQNCYNVKFLS